MTDKSQPADEQVKARVAAIPLPITALTATESKVIGKMFDYLDAMTPESLDNETMIVSALAEAHGMTELRMFGSIQKWCNNHDRMILLLQANGERMGIYIRE